MRFFRAAESRTYYLECLFYDVEETGVQSLTSRRGVDKSAGKKESMLCAI
jgi:hypothetical protein